MVLTRVKVAVALITLSATAAPAQRGAAGIGRGMSGALGGRGSDGPRALLFGFALECTSCRLGDGQGRMGGGRGGFRVWHYDEYPRVAAVTEGGAAQRAGVRVGDVLLSVDGLSITTDEGAERFSQLRAGDEVSLTLDRAGKSFGVDLVLKAAGGRGMFTGAAPENAPSFTSRVQGVHIDVWSANRVVESTDSTGATILKIGDTVIRLAGDAPLSPARGRRGIP
jgi:membrane-associated protease RseP (regulator of RpoE activity)